MFETVGFAMEIVVKEVRPWHVPNLEKLSLKGWCLQFWLKSRVFNSDKENIAFKSNKTVVLDLSFFFSTGQTIPPKKRGISLKPSSSRLGTYLGQNSFTLA
jgi:hypothetical protein